MEQRWYSNLRGSHILSTRSTPRCSRKPLPVTDSGHLRPPISSQFCRHHVGCSVRLHFSGGRQPLETDNFLPACVRTLATHGVLAHVTHLRRSRGCNFGPRNPLCFPYMILVLLHVFLSLALKHPPLHRFVAPLVGTPYPSFTTGTLCFP